MQTRFKLLRQRDLQSVGAAALKFPGKASDPVLARIDLAAKGELVRRADVLKSSDVHLKSVLDGLLLPDDDFNVAFAFAVGAVVEKFIAALTPLHARSSNTDGIAGDILKDRLNIRHRSIGWPSGFAVKASWESKVKGLESAIAQFQARPTPNSSANPAERSGL